MARPKGSKKAEKNVEDPTPKKREKVVSDKQRDYSPVELFDEGETIYHKTWDDVGEVIEVGVTEDGIRKIRVQFEKVGLKTLCIGHSVS